MRGRKRERERKRKREQQATVLQMIQSRAAHL